MAKRHLWNQRIYDGTMRVECCVYVKTFIPPPILFATIYVVHKQAGRPVMVALLVALCTSTSRVAQGS